jgi:hypothetical protein
MFELGVGLAPDWSRLGQQLATSSSELHDSASAVGWARGDSKQPATRKRLERCGEGRSVHGEDLGNVSHARRVRPVQRHHQRELAVGEVEWTEGLVEASRQRPCRPLSAEAQAMIAHVERGFTRHGAWR